MVYWGQKTVLMWRTVSLASILAFAFSCENKNTQIKNDTASEKTEIVEGPLPYYNTPDFTPIFVDSVQNVVSKIDHLIAEFSFTDQEGNKITRATVNGKIHVADFFFTSCGSICPIMTKNMKRLRDSVGIDTNIVFLSYSVTPWHDNVAALHKYAEAHAIDSKNWHLLTGSKAEIYELARKSYFAEQDLGYTKDSTEFLHTEHFILVDKTGRIRGIYNGTLGIEIDQLFKDIEELRKEG
jgi:protein SCO1